MTNKFLILAYLLTIQDKLVLYYIGLVLSPFIAIIFKVLKNIANVNHITKFVNFFLPKKKRYIRFESSISKGIIFKKELIKELVNDYPRKYIRQNIRIVENKFMTIKGYNVRKMDGVSLHIIEREGFGGSNNIRFKTITVEVKKDVPFIVTTNEKGIKTYCNRYDLTTFIEKGSIFYTDFDIFRHVVYWRPVFTKEYKNWDEFNERFKLTEE